MKSWNRLLFLCLALAGGCAVGPNFKAPNAHAPAEFRGATETGANSLGDLDWWRLFQDPDLQKLIRSALTNNYDLRQATARVEQYRAMLAESRAAYYPLLGYEALSGPYRNAVGSTAFYTGQESAKYNYLAGAISWEIDLWGRLRRMNESARAQALASEEARHDVMTSLVSNVAQAYFQLLALDEELGIARDTTNSLGQSLFLFNERLRGGVASKLETSSAAAALASAAATIPELRRQIAIQENQLRVLVGTNPGPIVRPPGGLRNESLPDVPPGLPSALLERRPDIRQALQLMRAANAQIGVATANLFPRLSLTGVFGEVGPDLVPFTQGATTAWALAGQLAGPIFQGGQLRAQLRQVRAQWDQARFQYQATVLTAFQEVSDALVSRQELADENQEQARAVSAYQTAVQIANDRYVRGQSSYYELLQEQQLLFPAENSLTQTHLNQLLATIQLYKALGGGWKDEEK